MAEVNAARSAAEREIAEARPEGQLTGKEIKALVLTLKDVTLALADADPAQEAKVYAETGDRITYEPGSRVVIAEAQPPCTTVRVGGGKQSDCDWRIQPWAG